ncbi:hypothetical protein [Corynebacterium ulcerans]|uniref:hypothetical protein n=1 Tax=Corynebacterium ulcerans TaxID=65058 RepID=UPI000269D44B|nr:hypothetical protein [Corynebacterium ulcerans]AIT89187.1 Hypothetical protein Cul210932_1241 [Corynebacterium ulcerans]ESU58128.1 hypothetical protein D881_07180 [Corynebacterium ulcerans NCTC 12077]PLW03625.1 hypothetical protein BRL54_00065 [Corynebacterium ulcerans]SQG58815.1 Uncharacterised protein [Corynebacterium ulcerans]BAM27507.1 hypothetical protein CULC0102_1308 [Corynebacterium ulcerans 0102]
MSANDMESLFGRIPHKTVNLVGVLQFLSHKISDGERVDQALEKLDDDSRLIALALCHRIAAAFGLELNIGKTLNPRTSSSSNILRVIAELDNKRDVLTQVQIELPLESLDAH